MKVYPFNPDWCVAPGDHITEWLEAHGKTQGWLAKKCKRPLSQVSRMINGRIRLTERWAIELAKATGRPAHFWYTLEAHFRIGLATGKRRV